MLLVPIRLLLLLCVCAGAGALYDYEIRQQMSPRETLFGSAVDLSSDGLALYSAFRFNSDEGIAYIYKGVELEEGVAWPNATISAEDGSLIYTADANKAIDNNVGDTESVAFQSNYSVLVGSTVWTQMASLTASDGAASDYFSYAASIASEEAVITAYGATADAGAAYIFTAASDNTWSEQAILMPSDAASGDKFGYSVTLSTGGTVYSNSIAEVDSAVADGATGPSFIAIGARDVDSGAGAVYTFTKGYSSGSWSQQAKLQASDAATAYYFGGNVAASSDVVAVASEGHTAGAGAVYLFSTSLEEVSSTIYHTSWSQQQVLVASDQLPGDAFGSSLAVSNDNTLIVVGASGEDSNGANAGAVYLFTAESSDSYAWSHNAKLMPSDGGTGARFGNSVDTMTYTLSSYGRDVAVGAYNHESGRGAVYVFHEYIVTEGLVEESRTWSQSAILQPYGDGDTSDYFGFDLAYAPDGSNLLATKYRSDTEGAGYAYCNADATYSPATVTTVTIDALGWVVMIICQVVAMVLGGVLAARIRIARVLSHRTIELEEDVEEGLGAEKQQHQEGEGMDGDMIAPSLELQRKRTIEAALNLPGGSGRHSNPALLGPHADSPERGMYEGIGESGKTDMSEYPYSINWSSSTKQKQGVVEKADDVHTGKFSGSGSASAAAGAGKESIDELLDNQIKPGSRKNIISFQGRDFLFEITLALLTRVSTLCCVYILYARGASSAALGMLVPLGLFQGIPYLVFCVDFAYPKWLDRSIRLGIASHHLKPRYELTTLTVILGLFQLELIRFLPWRQSTLSILSRGFPTYRSFQVCVYLEILLDLCLFVVSLLAQLSIKDGSNVVLAGLSLATSDYVVWSWNHIMHMTLLGLRLQFLVLWVCIPVWNRAGLEANLKLADSPSAIPGRLLTHDGEILDHCNDNENEEEPFQSKNQKTGGVRITRVHKTHRKGAGAGGRAGGSELVGVSEGGSVISDVSDDDRFPRDPGSTQWQGASTEEIARQMRMSLNIDTGAATAEDKDKKKEEKKKKKKSKRDDSLFHRGNLSGKSTNSEAYASPISPYNGPARSGRGSPVSGQFTPRGSGKFSTASGKGSASSKSTGGVSGKESVFSNSVKTEIIEGTGYSSPLPPQHQEKEGGMQAALDAEEMSPLSSPTASAGANISPLSMNSSSGGFSPTGLSGGNHLPPRKPPKPRRLLAKASPRTATVHEEEEYEEKEEDDKSEEKEEEKKGNDYKGGYKYDKGEKNDDDAVDGPRAFDSLKSNVSAFPDSDSKLAVSSSSTSVVAAAANPRSHPYPGTAPRPQRPPRTPRSAPLPALKTAVRPGGFTPAVARAPAPAHERDANDDNDDGPRAFDSFKSNVSAFSGALVGKPALVAAAGGGGMGTPRSESPVTEDECAPKPSTTSTPTSAPRGSGGSGQQQRRLPLPPLTAIPTSSTNNSTGSNAGKPPLPTPSPTGSNVDSSPRNFGGNADNDNDNENDDDDDDDSRSRGSARSAEIKRRRAKAKARAAERQAREKQHQQQQQQDDENAAAGGEGSGGGRDSESIGSKLKKSKSALQVLARQEEQEQSRTPSAVAAADADADGRRNDNNSSGDSDSSQEEVQVAVRVRAVATRKKK